MELSSLTAISPIDGRYRSQTSGLTEYFSEFGLIKYRVLVEIRYFLALLNHPLPEFENNQVPAGFEESILENFSLEDALEIKEIEKTTNHDVKAVEYFLKEKLNSTELTIKKAKIDLSLLMIIHWQWLVVYREAHRNLPI